MTLAKIRCTILLLHVFPEVCMTCSVSQNALAYLSAAISYARKKFMKLTPVVDFIKMLSA